MARRRQATRDGGFGEASEGDGRDVPRDDLPDALASAIVAQLREAWRRDTPDFGASVVYGLVREAIYTEAAACFLRFREGCDSRAAKAEADHDWRTFESESGQSHGASVCHAILLNLLDGVPEDGRR